VGQVLHDCATTTHAVRAAIQRSKASVADLAGQYGINQNTVRKWRACKSVHGPCDRSMRVSVRRETGEPNPCRRQEKLEGRLLGHPPYPMVKT